MERIEFAREATEQELRERIYELIVRYLETLDQVIGEDPDVPPDKLLRDERLMKIMLQMNSVFGLMEGLRGNAARKMREKSRLTLRGYDANTLVLRMRMREEGETPEEEKKDG